MGKQSCLKFMLFLFLAVVPFLAVGCGGGGGGEGLTAGGPGAAGTAGVWRMTASGFIDEIALPQPAPDKLEAPDRQEAPAIPGVGYSVRAVNALTGQILATALSGADGAWRLTFATPKTSNMAVVLVAIKEKIILRAILPMKSADLYDMAEGSNYNITMQMAISQSTENVVQAVETELGLNKGDFGKLTTLPGTVTVDGVIAKSEEHGFILQPSGSFTFIGHVDIVDLTPAPTFSVSAGTAQYNVKFGDAVNISGSATALTGSLTGRNLTYKWTQTAGPTGTFTNSTSASASFTTKSLADNMAFNQNYLNANFPGSFARPDRFGIVPLTAQEANYNFIYTLRLTVTDADSGNSANGTVTISHLARQSGISNVAKGLPVLLNAPTAASFSWSLTKPDGSNATLTGSTTKNPYFVPDVAGTYTVTEGANTLTIYAGTYTGIQPKLDLTDDNEIPAIDPVNNGCLTACHNGTYAGDLSEFFTEWAETPHANLFKEELNFTGADYHYSSSCTGCHTVGYEPAANNGGFDDLLTSTGYVIQAAPNNNSHQYSALVQSKPALAALGSIACETCHGPSTSEGHEVTAARVSYDSAVCAVCHGRPAGHNRSYLWSQSGHANYQLAIDDGNSTSCGRCHSVQGFLAYLPRLISGNPGSLASAPATAATVLPQTCVACHDPHSDMNPNHLRSVSNTWGDTSALPSGYTVLSAGKGALCMTCHNTRNGAKSDSTSPSSGQAPHTASQADVLMSKNAYFIGTTAYPSPHATTTLPVVNPKATQAMPDTCVTCHMTLVPAREPSTGTNHKFHITAAQVCAKCHGAGMNATPIQTEIEELLEALAVKIQDGAKATMDKPANATISVAVYPLDAAGNLIDFMSDPKNVLSADIQSLEITEPHGRIGFFINFSTAQTFSCANNTNVASCTAAYGADKEVSATRVEVRIDDIKTAGAAALFPPATDLIIKAGWNYFLIEGDGSKGIHNRPFAKAILEAASAAMDSRTP